LLKSDPIETVRGTSAQLLGEHKVQEAIPDLEKALLDDDSGVRAKVRGALIEIFGLDDFKNKYFKLEFIHRGDLTDEIKGELEQNK
jgi:HEAT repeat protein